jgi:hypothetical protein
VSEVLFKIYPRKMCFTVGRCHVVDLEGSGKDGGTMSIEGGFHPLGCAG